MKKYQLKHSKVFRGGKTTNSQVSESSECYASVGGEGDTINLDFEIGASGGVSCVTLNLGKEDLLQILLLFGKEDVANSLHEFADTNPTFAVVLANCAAIAIKKNVAVLEKAEEAQKQAEREREREKAKAEEELARAKSKNSPWGRAQAARQAAALARLKGTVSANTSHK